MIEEHILEFYADEQQEGDLAQDLFSSKPPMTTWFDLLRVHNATITVTFADYEGITGCPSETFEFDFWIIDQCGTDSWSLNVNLVDFTVGLHTVK